MKLYSKNRSNNILKKTKDNKELKNIEVDEVNNFIKEKVK